MAAAGEEGDGGGAAGRIGRKPARPRRRRPRGAPARQQVNIRLSAEGKIALEAAARQQGFRGASDSIRSVALAAGRKG